MKVYFIKKGDLYWRPWKNSYIGDKADYYWDVSANNITCYWSKSQAFLALEEAVRKSNDAVEYGEARWLDKLAKVEKKDFKIVSWKGDRAAAKFAMDLDERISQIEKKLEDHCL